MVDQTLASLYIHIPFCRKKCPYCHFFVLKHETDKERAFIDALKKEWLLRKELFQGKTLVSIYFGGGTPTQLTSYHLLEILETIKAEAHLHEECEITLEANPEDILDKGSEIKDYRSAGFNRISLGVQSFDPDLLSVLGRSHSPPEAIQAIEIARSSGFSNISIDLMYESPHQTLESWRSTLKTAQTLPITHISLYNLTFEKGAKFYRIQDQLTPYVPSEDIATQMFLLCDTLLAPSGLKRYEISAFAKPGYTSKHNLGYWQGRAFIGLGPSAFSYWDKKRFQNSANFKAYIENLHKGQLPVDFIDSVSPSAHQKEMLAVGLRPLVGVCRTQFEKSYGTLSAETEEALAELEDQKLIEIDPEQKISLTPKGRLFHDTVAMQLVEA